MEPNAEHATLELNTTERTVFVISVISVIEIYAHLAIKAVVSALELKLISVQLVPMFPLFSKTDIAQRTHHATLDSSLTMESAPSV